MAGKTGPWWQKIPRIVTGALRGLRAGMAAFFRPGQSKSDEARESPRNPTLEDNRTLTEPFPHPDPAPAPEEAVSPGPEAAAETSAAQPQPASDPGPEPEPPASPADVIAEAALGPAPDAESEAETEPEAEPEVVSEPEPAAESEPEPPASPADVIAEAALGSDESETPAPADVLAEAALGPAPDAEAEAETETPEIEEVEAEFAPEIEAAAPEAVASPGEAASAAIEETVAAPEAEAAAAEPEDAQPEPVPSEPESPQLEAVAEAAAPSEAPSGPMEPEPTEPAAPASAEPPKPTVQAPHREAIRKEEGPDTLPVSVFVNEVYEGPFDLLLDLIRKQDIDIYDIPIAKITAQFLAYVNRLKASDMDVAGEFIYTASLLIHIKSKMLLPRTPSGPDDAQEDPRRELVERLLEHERFKNAAQMLQQKQMLEAATWTNPGLRDFKHDEGTEAEIAADTTDLVRIFREILDRARNRPMLNLEEDTVTVGQMIQFLARRLTMEDKPVALRRLLAHTKSERALIAMFLALLELVRLQAILLRQDRHFSEIFIKKNAGFESVMNQGMARDDWQ